MTCPWTVEGGDDGLRPRASLQREACPGAVNRHWSHRPAGGGQSWAQSWSSCRVLPQWGDSRRSGLTGTLTLPSSLWRSMETWREVAPSSLWTDVEGRPQTSEKEPPGALGQVLLFPVPMSPLGIVPFLRVVLGQTGQSQRTLGDKQEISDLRCEGKKLS